MFKLDRGQLQQVGTRVQAGDNVEVINEPEPLEIEGDERFDGFQVVGVGRYECIEILETSCWINLGQFQIGEGGTFSLHAHEMRPSPLACGAVDRVDDAVENHRLHDGTLSGNEYLMQRTECDARYH